MLSTVVVHAPGEYERWLAEASRAVWAELSEELFDEWADIDSAEQFEAFKAKLAEKSPEMAAKAQTLTPAFVVGEKLYKRRGCNSCHRTDNQRYTGPAWGGLWMSQRVFTDGTSAIADENYLREAIFYPKADVVQGYPSPSQMPAYQYDPNSARGEREVRALIAYIRTLKDNR
jgi:cytochrome c1